MLFKKQARKREIAVGLDLGSRYWKGVVVRRASGTLQLLQYAIVPAPSGLGKAESQPQAVEAVQGLLGQLRAAERRVNVAISTPSGLVAEIEMPRTPASELRTAVSLNSVRYLRRDLDSYYFDAAELSPPDTPEKARRSPTMRVLVAAAPKEEVLWYRDVLNAAKLKAETIELAAVTVINAFQKSHAEICRSQIVLLLDIGHQQTSLCFLKEGLPSLTRTMPFAGAYLRERLATTLGLAPAEAERRLYQLDPQGTEAVRSAMTTFAREIRASIDFVERQHDCSIRSACAGGGVAANELMLELLSTEVGVPIQQWNPLQGYDIAGLEAGAVAAVAPCFGAALGAATGAL